MPPPLPDEDFVSRIILDPKDYNHGGMLDLSIGFQFPSDDECCESANCNRLLGNDPAKIHALGYEKQAIQRQKNRNQIYKGYVEAKCVDIKSIRVETYHFTVFHDPMPENEAHCHIKMNYTIKGKPFRNTAISRLTKVFSDKPCARCLNEVCRKHDEELAAIAYGDYGDD